MEKFERILVCLDQSKLDVELIHAAGKICELGAKDITFINVIRDFTLPEEVKKEFPQFLEKALAERKEEIRNVIKEHFSWPNLDVHIKIIQADSLAKAVLQYAHKKDIDLIISGRKKKGTGVFISRVARRADCSLLMVAEGHAFRLKKILVPIDFSEYSRAALSRAIDFSRLFDNKVEILAQNVYNVPTGYHYTGKSYEEFAQVMKENAEKSFEAFIKTVDTQEKEIKPIYSLDDNDDFVSDIQEVAKKHKTDLIVIGARGQTAAAMLFIGSKAERIVMMQTSASMLLVRKKGDKAGLRELLKEL